MQKFCFGLHMWRFSRCVSLALVLLLLASCKKEQQRLDISDDILSADTLIKEIIEEIRFNYADDIAREKLEIGAINGMLSVLDEHSLYITNEEFSAYSQSTRGSFLGVGIEIKRCREGVEVQSVIDESPAANFGIKPLDVITSIDGKDVQDMQLKDIVSRLSSDSAMKVRLTIARNKTERLDILLKKSVVQIPSIKLNFVDDIAIVKITHFNENSLLAVSQATYKLIKKDARGLVLDLRNNPGGILEQAVGVADLFLVDKKIVELKSRNADESRLITSDSTDLLSGLPMAVLVNSGTASGAELLAAALGENKRAIIIGEKTYGKGSLQTVIPIPGRGAIKLTTAYFISPNGNMIEHNGVSPDIELTKEELADNTTEIPTANSGSGIYVQDVAIKRAVDLLHGISALSEDG
ncbi:MAG: S41 family peptidase [Alphaproteobacteria bacterium]|nr:S41 family peptidase [Alphaproteobacteria bacterium]